MAKNKQNRGANSISLICNFLVIALTIYSVLQFFFGSGDGNMEGGGAECFRYFTIDSNVLCAVSCLFVAFFNLKGKGIPKNVIRFKEVGTVAVTVTFVTVAAFLGPTIGYPEMIEGCNLFLHVINPLLAMVSFMFLEGRLQTRDIWLNKGKRTPMTLKESFLAVIPVAIYGGIYGYMVLYTKWWDDFYGFNSGIMEGKWYISIAGMAVMTLLICMTERGVHAAFFGSEASRK